MNIGLAQINTIVGDLEGNRKKIGEAYHALCAQGADLVVYPELTICGYPPRDLLFKRQFFADNEATLLRIAKETGEIPALIGFVARSTAPKGRPFANAAAWCQNGTIGPIAHKCLLPSYDVFDEDRYFEPASAPLCVPYKNVRIGLTICEDIWMLPGRYAYDPIAALEKEAPDLVVNLSASPWHRGRNSVRREWVTRAAQRCRCPVVYCNLVGGNDELIFDGGSMVMTAEGTLLAGCARFRETSCLVALTDQQPTLAETFDLPPMEEDYQALILGLRDYAQKNGFRRALLGISGGVDSALTAVLAAEALGPENVTGFSLPSRISSPHSLEDAVALAKTIGIAHEIIPIEAAVATFQRTLAPLFKGRPEDRTEENLQARTRGVLLMALSNKFNSLLLTTGNKSELAVGYCTLYGDMCGGLAVLSDVPKTTVYALCHYLNQKAGAAAPIPEHTLTKPPSAELRIGQTDRDTLPPYDVLDAILQRYIEEGQSSAEIIAAGFEEGIVRDVILKVDLNEYKRKQAPLGLKITPLAFGVGRRLPIAQRYIN